MEMNKLVLKSTVILILLFLTSCGNSGKKDSQVLKPIINPISEVSKPTINVYIENSGSMDGFVNRGNEFTSFITSYLTDISIKFSNDINLYYINSSIISLGSDLKNFTSKLDATSFRQMGGNRGETHIFQLLDTLLKVKDNNSISIFITDGIFSPGKKKDANKYIIDQYNGIKQAFSNYSSTNPNSAVVIYQLLSQFNGTYFDRNDTPIHNVLEELPYFVWLIGDMEKVKKLVDNVSITNVRFSNDPNIFAISKGNKEVTYAVKRGSGNFKLDKSYPKKIITNLRKEKRTGKVKFSVDADMSEFLLNNDYLLNPDNYSSSNSKYRFTVKKALSNQYGYTHTFEFIADNIYKGDVSILLKSQIPQWVEDVNDNVGLNVIHGRTFGIKHQIHGVYEAFTFNNDNYTEISIKIK
ncbi:MAG: hypothetical protein Q8S23_08700 [Bacteroidales bacterium]|nr:hypothetical protein [Bacteroidales bacterium]